jgi:hypothetical protein
MTGVLPVADGVLAERAGMYRLVDFGNGNAVFLKYYSLSFISARL